MSTLAQLPGNLDLSYGTSEELVFELDFGLLSPTAPAGTLPTPFPLVGYTVVCNAYTSNGLTVPVPCSITDSANGKIQLTFTQGLLYPDEAYTYEVVLTDSSGRSRSIVAGQVMASSVLHQDGYAWGNDWPVGGTGISG